MELPKNKIKATSVNPKVLLIYSKPKTGKSSIFSELDNNLILDLEHGTDYLDALKINIENLDDLRDVAKKIKEAGYPYKYITLDTVTALEDMIAPLAKMLYQKTPMGKNFNGESVLNLPQGAGYLYVRQAFFQVLDFVKTLAPNIILAGHLKEKQIDDKGEIVAAANIDLTGKIKSLICAQADAIAYLYRKEPGVNALSFISNDEVTCGARSEHLRNKEIIISEMKDGKFTTYWDRIYLKER